MPRSPEKILARFWNNLDSLERGLVLWGVVGLYRVVKGLAVFMGMRGDYMIRWLRVYMRITRPQILNPSLRIHSTSPARFWGLGCIGFGSKGSVLRLNCRLV